MNNYKTLKHIQNDILQNKITLRGLVLHYLDNINAKKHLNAFVEVFETEAIQKAEQIDEKIQSGNAGKLAGMVVALKDNICYKGHAVSASSKILEGFQSVYSATVVQRLLAEDAIIIGRLNCDEFAMGASNETSYYGPVKNPIDETRVSGGSSGGAAVAVSANMCLAAIASDTGGSVRQPAAFCGVIGIKPTYGRVSRNGLLAYASSFDQIGPITQSMDDMKLLMEVISGKDPADATTSSRPVPNYNSSNTIAPQKIGYIKECLFHSAIDEEIKQATLAVIDKLKQDGHTVEEISFPYLDYLVPTYYVLTTAEASSNLSRFSGLTFGHRSKQAVDLETVFKNSRSEGFGKEVKRRIMLGTFVLSAGSYEAYYTKAQQVRRLVQDKTNEIFDTYDFILSPTTPTTAFKFGEKSDNPIAMYLADLFTVHANISGNPAISVPMGTHTNKMPMGIQLMAKHFCEGEMMTLAETISS
ncbi:MAG: Asp-tRNA(Asn)/Glu-tRNA(Gln) amidotransferase subunit GatA [Bacteroidia bacterium]|nr:Asp-tRNA(Asn)/Glu-tRNA(Gln) amidotransferase subunit GatA [Bacteroidia bacterium]MCC7533967.1 Asp-tRNA(Asn)/Glu-tRNA(Gln) amidotransferase subunit GatA [Bacteroidia bacterium]